MKNWIIRIPEPIPLGDTFFRAIVRPERAIEAEYALEPGSEPGMPHYHARHSDTFYVLEGQLEFVIDGKTVRAMAGTVLAAPRGAIHAFPVAIGGRARFLNLHTPGGFERYIRELTAMRARGETPTDEFFRSHDQYNV